MNVIAVVFFAAVIALVFAVITGLGTLLMTWDLAATATSSSGGFCMTFLAVLLLATGDLYKQWRLQRSVRKRLLAREDLADDEFFAPFTKFELEIARHSRTYIAALFRVPEAKLRPTDKLNRDYEFDVLGGVPSTSLYVLERLGRTLRPNTPIAENVEELKDFRDLVIEIHRIARLQDQAEDGQ